MVAISGGFDNGIVPVAVTPSYSSMIIACVVPAIRGVWGFRGIIPGRSMKVIAVGAAAGTVAMRRYLISSEQQRKD